MRKNRVVQNIAKGVLLFFLSALFVHAADGSGTNTVSPTSVTASAVDQTATFTFTAGETMDAGEVRILVPTSRGWSAPQATSGTAGYTTVSASGAGTIATVLNAADSSTGWTEDDSDACNASSPTNGWGLDTSVFREGTGSITCNNTGSTGPDATDSFGYDFTAQNWSSYTQVGFWVRSTVATASGDIQAAIDDTNTCASPIEEYNIPALTANTWTYIKWTFTGAGSARTSVTTFCINAGSNGGMDSKQIWVDEMLVGPGTLTFPANGSDVDIAIRILDLANTETLTVTYGSGGGASGADAPTTAATDTFTTRTRISANGTLTNIAAQPTITVTAGSLTVDIVDASGTAVASPSVTFSALNYAFESQTSTGTLGVSSQRIRVSNTTATATWTLTIAATSGATALWSAGTPRYDYNDASGATDGSDSDSSGGRLTIDPSVGTVTAVSPCTSTAGITRGSSASYSETSPVVSSITLLSASSSASTSCTWDFTGVSLSQSIPASQATGTYTISLTLTVA